MMNKLLITFFLVFMSSVLFAESDLASKSLYTQKSKNSWDKYGFMFAYAPVREAYSARVYGIPKTNELAFALSYFSLFYDRKGSVKGGMFDDQVLDFWQEIDNDIYRKYLMNWGVTQALTPNKMLLLAYYAGVGLYQEFHQYKSSYGNYWYRQENKMTGDIGLEVIGRLGQINLGLGFSYQANFYLAAGFEF